MRSITIIILLILTAKFAVGQTIFKATDKQYSALKADADSCATNLIKGNYARLADFICPQFIEMMGGKEKMVRSMLEQAKEMRSRGIFLKAIVIDTVQNIVESEKDLYCYLREEIKISKVGEIVTTFSYQLAYSHDNGLHWYITDTAGLKGQDPKKYFPTYPSSLIMPIIFDPMAH